MAAPVTQASVVDPVKNCYAQGHRLRSGLAPAAAILSRPEGVAAEVHVSRQQRYEPLRFTSGTEGVSDIRINSSDALVVRFEQRAAALHKALKDKDADAILTLFKGKCLYSTMQGLLQKVHDYDLPEPAQWYLQLRASKDFEATMSRVSWLSAFRTKVKDFLAG